MKHVFLIVAFVISLTAICQNYNLPEQRAFKKGTIGLKDAGMVNANNLSISNDSVSYIHEFTLGRKSHAIKDINFIRVQTGSKAGQGALLGATVMGLHVLYAVMEINSNPNMVFRQDALGRSLLFIGGGALIGTLIGSMIPSWATYYPNSLVFRKHIVKPDFFLTQQGIGVHLKLRLN